MHGFRLPDPATNVSYWPASFVKPELVQLPLFHHQDRVKQRHVISPARPQVSSGSPLAPSQRTLLVSKSAPTNFRNSVLQPSCHHDTPAHQSILPKPYPTNRTLGRKPADSDKYSRTKMAPRATNKVAKRNKETRRRKDQARALSLLQQTLLVTNPSLFETAAARSDKVKCGWSPLIDSNICWDLNEPEGIDPLRYNKMDIFGSSNLVHQQSNVIIDDIIIELSKDFHDKAIFRGDLSLAHKLANLINRIDKARKTRGEDEWFSPKQLRDETNPHVDHVPSINV